MAENIKLDKDINAKEYLVEHWLIGEGEAVNEGDQLLTVQADGKSYIIHAPFAGILFSKNFDNGEAFVKGDTLGELITPEEAGDIKVSDKLSETNRRIIESLHIGKRPNAQVSQAVHVKATPSARRVARSEKINLELVHGTGPNGRIQLQDVVDYIKSQSGHQARPARTRSKKVEYGLPPTRVAQRMADEAGLDVSKVPAPPDATRVRKDDVERYLNNPSGAEDIIKREYGMVSRAEQDKGAAKSLTFPAPPYIVGTLPEPTGKSHGPAIRLTTDIPLKVAAGGKIELDLKTQIEFPSLSEPELKKLLTEPQEEQEVEEPKVIRLSTEEPVKVEGDGVIMLNTTRFDGPLKLEAEIPLALEEPAPAEPIRMPSEEVPSQGSGEAIELTSTYKPPTALEGPAGQLALNEPGPLSDYSAPAIRMPSSEPSKASGEGVISLPLFDLGDIAQAINFAQEPDQSAETLLEPSPGRIVHLSTLVDLNLLEIFKAYLPEDGDIAKLTRNYILSTIFKAYKSVFETETIGAKAVFVPDIERDVAFAFDAQTVDGVKNQIAAAMENGQEPVEIEKGDLIIVDLLAYDLRDVFGLVDSVDRVVVYFSFIKDLGRFVIKPEDVSIKNMLSVNLDFDTRVIDPVKGVAFIQAIRTELEKFKVNRDE